MFGSSVRSDITIGSLGITAVMVTFLLFRQLKEAFMKQDAAQKEEEFVNKASSKRSDDHHLQ